MFGFFLTLFVILCVFLAIFILIQPGKGDMGLGSLGGSGQLLFGGSGGQDFFTKATWIMGAIFMFGALGLSILKSHETRESRLQGFVVSKTTENASSPTTSMPTQANNQPLDPTAGLGEQTAQEETMPQVPAKTA